MTKLKPKQQIKLGDYQVLECRLEWDNPKPHLLVQRIEVTAANSQYDLIEVYRCGSCQLDKLKGVYKR